MINRQFATLNDAHGFLTELGASAKLLLHVKLVGEAADIIIKKLVDLKVVFDADFVRLGVAFHDVGKIIHPKELSDKGSLHENEGEKLLLEKGVDKKIARCCNSHGKWNTMECSFEEYLIALADKLWKGKRENSLENIVINQVAEILNQERWNMFMELDSCFEQIASDGDSRLIRSQNY
jgi:HD domain